MKRFAVTFAVFRRELLSYFTTPTGYLFITLFIVASGYFNFSYQDAFFSANIADLTQLNSSIPYLLMLFAPAVTMSVWSSERASGTDALLLTLPSSDAEIALGKYFAMLAVYSVALLFSLSHVIVLMALGDPDLGLMFANFFGYWLVGSALLATAMVGSLLSRNATISFVLGTLFCGLVVWAPSRVPDLGIGLSEITNELGVVERLKPLAGGEVSLSSVVYFIALTAAMLYINVVMIGKRHWSGGADGEQMWIHYLVRSFMVVVAAFCLTTTFDATRANIDATAESLHSLSPVTVEVLEKLNDLPEGQSVFIEAFVSPEPPPEWEEKRRDLVNTLAEIEENNPQRIRIEIHDTDLFSKEAERAAEEYQINSRPVQSDTAGTASTEDLFMGIAVRSGSETVVVDFLYPGLQPEYVLTRSISSVSGQTSKRIGIVKNKISLFGGTDFQTGATTPDSPFIEELRLQHELVQVNPDLVYPKDNAETTEDEGIDVLVVAMPSSLTQDQMDRLRDWILEGNPTLILEDPYPFLDPALIPLSLQQQRQANPNPEPDEDVAGDATQFYASLGLDFQYDGTMADPYNPRPAVNYGAFEDYFVFVHEESGAESPINEDHATTSYLQEVAALFAGKVEKLNDAKISVTPLLSSSNKSFWIPSLERAYENHMWKRGALNLRLRYPSAPVPPSVAAGDKGLTIAAAVKGDSDGPQSKLDMILLMDADMAIHPYFYEMYKGADGGQRLDNVQFLLNAIDMLAGDETLIELRSRRKQQRILKAIADVREEFEIKLEEEREKAERTAAEKIAEARERMQELVKEIDEGDLKGRAASSRKSEVQTLENRRVGEEQREIENEKERAIARAKRDLLQDIESVQDSYKAWALVLPPLPTLMLGIAVFFMRWRRERTTDRERRNL